jgi:hypothetical protein
VVANRDLAVVHGFAAGGGDHGDVELDRRLPLWFQIRPPAAQAALMAEQTIHRAAPPVAAHHLHRTPLLV